MPAFGIRLYTAEARLTPAEFFGVEAKKFAERIVDDLHAAGLVVKGTTGFYDQMPDVSGTCVSVIDLGGVPSHTPAPQMLVQFRVRAASWDLARDKAAAIYNFYHTETDKTITGYRIIAAIAEGLPAHMGEDGRQRHIVGFNMMFKAHSTNQGDSTVGFGGKRDPNEA